VTHARLFTLLWPGMPWLWLRGSLAGLVLALAFGVAVDVALLTTWIWTELVDLPISIGLWTAVAAVWLVATVSAVSAFPPAIRTGRDEAADTLFVKARNAYLARDWLLAETQLRTLLDISPTDGEAQLLLATLLRRAGRVAEAREAFHKLSRSDSGAVWRSAIAREIDLMAADEDETVPVAEPPAAEEPAAILPLTVADEPAGDRDLAA
jgi:tetratricopeptide (TPR) repeat protein